MIRRYPGLRKKSGSLTAKEAMKYDAILAAIEHTSELPDGFHRIKLIRLTYWSNRRLTLQGAALDIPCSYSTARRWNYDFFMAVAENYGQVRAVDN